MILFINPKLVVQQHDTYTTGIVYMPVSLAFICGALTESNLEFQLIDAFGENPQNITQGDGTWSFGADVLEVLDNSDSIPSHIFIFANQAANHNEILNSLRQLSKAYPSSRIYILENSQAVTAYSLAPLKEDFLSGGATGVILGDPFTQSKYILNLFGYETFDPNNLTPDWDKFPLENYWRFKLSHGPQTSNRYLPILSSFGCPWACSFCVVPATNNRKWITRKPEKVVAEILHLKSKFGVHEFHFEDLNSTVSTSRIIEIAKLLIPLNIEWKIVAGTKAETLNSYDTLQILKTSGLNYFSFSPESGSKKIRKIIDKKFDVKHSLSLINWSRKLGINTQACFILGMPDENIFDRFKTLNLIRVYSVLGISEVAIFIISPMPGSALFSKYEVSLGNISFSPTWRNDYKKLAFVRIYWYLNFLILKSVFHPIQMFKSIFRFFRRDFLLKMELAPFRSRQWKKWSRGLAI